MRDYNNFMESNIKKGKPGEDAFYKYACKKYGDKNVKDVSDDPKWQQKSVDFLVRDTEHNNQILKYEVKNDYTHYKTGNFVVEYWSDCARKAEGWWPKIVRANLDNHFLVYRDAYSGEAYIIDCKELKQYIDEHPLKKVNCWEPNGSKYGKSGLLPEDTILWELNSDYIKC